MCFKVSAGKNVFSGAVTEFEKKNCFKVPFLTITSEHPDAVTVKNFVLKYTLETCVLEMIFQIQSPFYFY